MRLLLFGTVGCHLCDQAETMIDACLGQHRQELAIESIDIAEQAQWHEQYAIRIPVLFHPESGKELAWPFDELACKQFLASL